MLRPGALRLRCCKDVARAGDSEGMRVFHHVPGARCAAVGTISERLPHLLLRSQITSGATAAGWEVEPESGIADDGYDLVARAGLTSVVFRIHPSEPAPAARDLEVAQRLYSTVGHQRVIWLCRVLPPELDHDRRIRFFQLIPTSRISHQVAVGRLHLDPDDFARRGLVGDVRFAACAAASPLGQQVRMASRPMRCPSCGTDNPVVCAAGTWTSACGRDLGPFQLHQLPLKHEAFQAAIARADGRPRVEFRSGHGWINVCTRCAKALDVDREPPAASPLSEVQDLGRIDLGEEELRACKLPTSADPHWCCGRPMCPPVPAPARGQR